MPAAYGATELNHSRIHHPTQEVIMEVALIPGLFVAIFVGIAAMILWWPYDK
jgi:hypothetical protein